MPGRTQLHRKMKPPARNSKPSARNSTRHASEELGQGDLVVRRNPRTGRPIRESAGRRKSDSAYVSTADAVDDEGDSFFDPSEDEEGNPKKRKRTPSPAPPDFDLIPAYEVKRYGEQSVEDSFARSPSPDPTFDDFYRPLNGDAGDTQTEPETLSLTLNIPPGFSGPVHFTIDKKLLQTAKRQRKETSAPVQHKSQTESKPSNDKPKENLILKLPPELRRRIYNLLFKTEDALSIHDPHNFGLSSAFLRTCKQIHDEGCAVLYSDNHFGLTRNPEMRAPLWIKEKKEVGYHDLHLWLETIGPVNIARLRCVTLALSDALPSARGIGMWPCVLNFVFTKLMHLAEERKFVRDDHLIHSLRMLARYGKLQEIDIVLSSRKPILRTDFRFMDSLRRVKCDEVRFNLAHWMASRSTETVEVLKKNMVRRVDEVYD
ncbi:hypothetical protein IWX49DRAFT_128520 [Phyllosticta citricarpa]